MDQTAHITHAALSARWSHCHVISLENWCTADKLDLNVVLILIRRCVLFYRVVNGFGLLSCLFSGSYFANGNCDSQAPSKEVVPSDLPVTHILSYLRSLSSLLSVPRPSCSICFFFCFFFPIFWLIWFHYPSSPQARLCSDFINYFKCTPENVKKERILPLIHACNQYRPLWKKKKLLSLLYVGT